MINELKDKQKYTLTHKKTVLDLGSTSVNSNFDLIFRAAYWERVLAKLNFVTNSDSYLV